MATKRQDSAGPKALVIRRTAQGTKLSAVPDEHVFSARWIARELSSGLAHVTVTLTPDDGDEQTFEVTGFAAILDDQGRPAVDGDGNARLNFTGWEAQRAKGGSAKRG